MDATTANLSIPDDVALLVELRGIPSEFILSQLCEAEQDARRVGEYLTALMNELGERHEQLRGADWRTLFAPAVFLDLAAALRILEWQETKLVRPEMDLPDAYAAIRQVIISAPDPEFKSTLSLKVMQVFKEHFAWHAPRELGCYVLLDHLGIDEDELATRLAELLFQHP